MGQYVIDWVSRRIINPDYIILTISKFVSEWFELNGQYNFSWVLLPKIHRVEKLVWFFKTCTRNLRKTETE